MTSLKTLDRILFGSCDAEWCNGSTADSDSVCEGSNPSSAAISSIGIMIGWFIKHKRAFLVLDILAVVLLFIGSLKSFVDRGILAAICWIVRIFCSDGL